MLIFLLSVLPMPSGFLANGPGLTPAREHPVAAPAAPRAGSHVLSHPLPNQPAPVFHGLAQGAYRSNGVTPASWGGSKLPPGAPIPRNLLSHPANWSDPNGSGINWTALAKFCYGVWPTGGGQAQYLANCYGHDEPGLDPYSNLPGSGGNVSWNITLPTGRNDTEIQSALYSAIWFGMVLTDPYAWMDQCFLELQFYPDSSWGLSQGSAGNWVGAAVAWQIEAATGAEDPCFYQQLTVQGSSNYFNMFGGDNIRVTMTGWIGSPYGENLTITDVTGGGTSFVNLYNSALYYPLDPSYLTSSFPNALQWTPGGELPVSFAFETGHSNSNFPNTNQYGGCSAGPPPPTPTNPSVPCPSYDPGSWANDTVTPWLIQPPVFFNATARETATQVGFTQDFAAILFIDGISNGACLGRDGSAWCSYPWYSFSCLWNAFEFGATDYPGVTRDFGKYNEYPRPFLTDSANLGYYPPGNFSVPGCASPTYSIVIGALGGSGAGTARLLGTGTTTSSNVTGLTVGQYALSAEPSPGYRLIHWVTTGGASVDFTNSPWASLNVTGNGSVTAVFGPITAGTVTIHFVDERGWGWQAIGPGLLYDPVPSTKSLGVNGSITLLPGVYSILGYAKPGFNFTAWQSNNSGASVAADGFPYTWLVVTGSTSVVRINVTFTPSFANASVTISWFGATGAVTFNGQSVGNGAGFSLAVGTYPLVATPSSGNAVGYISAGGIGIVLDQHDATNVTVEAGFVSIVVMFDLAATVTVATAGGDGNVSIDGLPFAGNHSAVVLPAIFAPGEFTLYATEPTGKAFSRWTVANPADLWVVNPNAAVTAIWVNTSSTLTAHYVPAASLYPVVIRISPAGSGSVSLDGGPWTTTSPWFLNLSAGAHLLEVTPGSMYVASWTSAGGLTHSAPPSVYPVGAQLLGVGTKPGWLNGTFTRPSGVYFPVTIVAEDATGKVKIDGVARPNGGTIVLLPGSHTVTASFPAPLAFVGFEATSNLTLVTSPFATTVNVQGAGTVYAISTWPIALSVKANVTGGRAPLPVSFSSGVAGARAPWTITWNFNDGSTPVIGAFANHTFAVAGFYNVTTTVMDSVGGSGSMVTLIKVLPPALTALAVANVTSGIAPLTVSFVGHGSSGVPPYTYNWTFGDGSAKVIQQNATHTFTNPGTFTVNFYLNDSARQHVVFPMMIVASSSLTASIAASPLSGAAPLVVKFQGVAHKGTSPYTYAWAFGDGVDASGANVSYTYRVAGTYNVSLLVNDRFGSLASSSVEVNVTPQFFPLSVSIVESSGNVTLGKSVTIRADATGGTPPYTYLWGGLPPGCTGAGVSFTCTPTANGTYQPNVTVGDSAPGDSASTTVQLIVYKSPSTGPGGPGSTPTSITSASSLAWVPYVAIAVLIGAGVVAFAMYRRRPPSSAEGGSDDAPDPGAE
ncbi:MAG: PKD domain-containing protein [Thermoplasmata archaeon]|nr:PKD domain-containing protein [Thermoplasmata archaeon]